MRLIGAGLAALVLAAAPAAAEERINRFGSDVAIQKDSSLEVTETIDVQAEGEQIRQGLIETLRGIRDTIESTPDRPTDHA